MNPDDARAATQIVERSAKNQEKARGKPEEKREEGKTRGRKNADEKKAGLEPAKNHTLRG
ncbi:hypothetical protein [Paraburkholderia tropica]|uniref:hypothetical protein n=1 Tax=Paraburkholderia tropica TaxID=92647 RepID=UPI000F5519D7|nr:hypothetical protein [Paraburkholderia tropica]RQN37069.1 hypothetical protein EHZ25_20975 [Paraburkholderia tropica]